MDGRMWSSRGRAALKILREQNDPEPLPYQEEIPSSSTTARPVSIGRSSFRPQRKKPSELPAQYAPPPLLERSSATQQELPTPPLMSKGRSKALNLRNIINAQRAAKWGESATDEMQSVIKGVENLTVLPSTSASDDAKNTESGEVHSDVGENVQSKRSESGSTYFPKDIPTDIFGTFGNRISVKTNYLEVYFKEEKLVYVYNITFQPDSLDTGQQQRLLNRHCDVLTKEMVLCGNCICTPFELTQQKFEFADNLGAIDVKIQVQFLKKVKLSEWMNPMNLIFQKVMDQLQLVKINNKMFDPKTREVLASHKLEIWKGYDVAIKDCKKGVLLSCDLAHSILRLDTVWDLYKSILVRYKNNLSPAAMNEFKNSIVSCTVITRYNNKSYRISDVSFEETPEEFTFKCNNLETNCMRYYKDMYGIEIKDSKQPLLVYTKKVPTSNGRKRRTKIMLIPELCYMTGIDEKTRSDFRIMKDIGQFTWSKPNDRYIAIQVLINRIYDCAPAVNILQTWGVNISNEPITTNARVINNNNIFFRDRSCGVVRGGWSKESGRCKVLEGVNLQQWLIIATRNNRNCMRDLVNEFFKIGSMIGIPISQPIEKILENDYIDSFLQTIRKCNSMQMVVIISPTNRTDRYNAIKKLCCVDLGLPSQVVNARTISRRDKVHSIAVKILLQMNCKLGGELWRIDMPVQTNGTMFCGMDVYHNTKDQKASVAGFVSSTNINATTWHSNVHRQYCGQELIDFLCQSITQSIHKWQEKNNSYPKRIIVYRDGISSGMLSNVRELEIESLLRGIEHSVGHNKIPLTFIITNKRISTRIFLDDRNLENAPVGTILDNTITTDKWYDFFMVSQHALQGTVCPAHYIVAYDDSHLKPDHIQALTLKLCHLYYNWTGTISVPAPCKYAHKLAQLVGQNIQCDRPSDFLSDKLYYL